MATDDQLDKKPALPKKDGAANQHTINLTPSQIEALNRLAGRLGCVTMTGKKAGEPSWRSMIRFIAMGFLAVSRPGSQSVMVGPVEGGKAEKKKEEKPFRCHPQSPPKFWPADTGCMDRHEWEAKTRLGEEELLAMGFSLTAEGTLWRAPRNWRAWSPIAPVPDWWDDHDASGAMALEAVPEGVDVTTDGRFIVSGGMVWPARSAANV